jgi:Na+/pantothenate symporter
VSRDSGQAKTTEDYFLAGRTLPWWAIGASLIAANISAEQIIGQSGQGYVVGLAIAAYEWQAAIVLLIVAKYFLAHFSKARNLHDAAVSSDPLWHRGQIPHVVLLDRALHRGQFDGCFVVGWPRD